MSLPPSFPRPLAVEFGAASEFADHGFAPPLRGPFIGGESGGGEKEDERRPTGGGERARWVSGEVSW